MGPTKPFREKIKSEVRKRYSGLITQEKGGSCCGPSSPCCAPAPAKERLVNLADYSDTELNSVPSEAAANSFGCGNPLAFAGVKEGQTVLDIGSGAGIDCFLAAQKVGKTGRVIGLDMTPEMVEKAKRNAAKGGFANVEFRLGEAEAMPVKNASVDWIISNCVINLSPDKPKVFREMARVLKSGGRFSISDIVLGDDLPERIANNMRAWTSCIAGAIRETEYLEGLRKAGLEDVTVESRVVYDRAVIMHFLNSLDSIGKARVSEEALEKIQGNIWSAKIKGKKK